MRSRPLQNRGAYDLKGCGWVQSRPASGAICRAAATELTLRDLSKGHYSHQRAAQGSVTAKDTRSFSGGAYCPACNRSYSSRSRRVQPASCALRVAADSWLYQLAKRCLRREPYPDSECGHLENAFNREKRGEGSVHVVERVLQRLALIVKLAAGHEEMHRTPTKE